MKKRIEIGKPCSPSTILGTEEIKATKVVISYGGGMGGSSRTLYAKKIKKVEDNFYKLTLIDDKIEEVGINFVVSKRAKTILKLSVDRTAHANYHKHTCNKQISVQYFEFDSDEEYTIVDKSLSVSTNNIQTDIYAE